MAFLETPRFPDCIAFGSVFTPFYNTSIIVLGSGHEKRNINWEYSRTRVNVATGVKRHEDLEDIVDMFHIANGSANGFRIKNHLDFNSAHTGDTITSADQIIGTGDGVDTTFQLVKKYTSGALTQTRNVTKPVTGTTLISLNGVTQSMGFTVDTTTGIVTFSSPPGVGVVVRAGFQYDIPVRFESDELPVVLSQYQAGEIQVNLVEIK